MQGLGNDFLVFDVPAAGTGASLDPAKVRALADRHTGVGFDQALMLEAPHDAKHRVYYRIFNSDGGEVEQCGNGARCIAALLYARAPELGRELVMESKAGIVRARIRQDGLVSVDMGAPDFEPRAIPLDAHAEAPVYALDSGGETNRAWRCIDRQPARGAARAGCEKRAGRAAGTDHRAPCALSRGVPMWVSCKSSIAATSRCAYTSAAWARRWPAARAHAPRSRWGGGRDFWRRKSGSTCRAGRRTVSWPGPGTHVWLTGPATQSLYRNDRHLTRHHRELRQ